MNSRTPESDTKKDSVMKKIVVFLSLLILTYFAFQYWKLQRVNLAKNEVTKFDNIDSEIFEVSDEYKNQEQYDLSDMTISEMREKGAEFIYQMLLKNQIQIENLKGDIQLLKSEILKYKNHEKIGKLIVNYVALREKIFAGEIYNNEFKSFEILSFSDENLKKLTANLQENLQKFSTNEKLSQDFAKLAPDLIAIQNFGDGNDFITKVRRNISKLATVRRTDREKGNDINAVIFKVEKLLREKNYQEALNSINSLELKYQETLKIFVENLKVSIAVSKIDQEILNYLKDLT
jgi:hypothetical protein